MRKTHSLTSYFNSIREQAAANLRGNRAILPVNAGYLILFLHMLHFTIRFLFSLYRLDYSFIPLNPVYLIFWLTAPILLYLYSTKYSFYNFHQIKLLCLGSVLSSAFLIMLSLIYCRLSRVFLPTILRLPVDEAFTKNMVLLLGRLATQLPLIPIGLLLSKGVFFALRNPACRKKVLAYKITHTLEPEAQKKNEISYNMNIVRDINTGKNITVYAKDRFLHTLIDGTSGTGKTSSTILPAIRDDLNMRCKAEDMQKSHVKQLEAAGLIAYSPPANTRSFSVNDCIPIVKQPEDISPSDIDHRLQEIQKELEDIRLNYPMCGLTVLAPDDSLTDAVCRLCDARDIPYNRIDAVRDADGKHKKNTIGLNPFYIPPQIEEEAKNQMIVKRAVIFSDVMQAITDLKGKADSYFTGLNRQMIANLAILVMATVPILRKRQATPTDLQAIINNFDLLTEYVDKLEELDRGTKQYAFIIQYIREDLLGKGRDKMEDQSRGTRNIINEFLLMPANREIFCSQNSIDFDRALANGEVTVCNYNLASGDTDAVAFGLFFLLSFNNAVLSRPGTEFTRIPHFFYVDELPVLIHPSLEKNFSLFRKFRVAMTVAIQTLDQMEKNEITKYLKGVILGCAHIIVFGRSSLSDMEIFSALAGVHDVTEVQKSTTETAITDSSPHFSFSSREMTTQKNFLEEIDIRMKDFQEVTFFTTRNGRPLPALQGIVEFLKPKDWENISRSNIFFYPVTINADSPIPDDLDIPDDIAAVNEQETGYSLLSGTPLSYFQSASKKTVPDDSDDTNQTPANTLPDGSENIDDIL
ncbi:MAG: TraM recognition domain-containing protein [Acetatifactor sp.]|nr:TraM recognition domain-containing protein [Acetatifactor sp.]